MKKKFRQFFIFLLVVSAVLALAGFAYRYTGHQALEKYVAGLRDQGEKLTPGELSATLSTNLHDSASALANVVGKVGPAPRHLDDLVATVLLPYSYSEQGRVRVAWKLEVPAMCMSPKGGLNGTWADLSNSVAAVRAPLEELREAVKRPSPNSGPRENQKAPASPDAVANAASWLAAATLIELHYGHRNEALANLQAFLGLAAMNREDYDPSSQIRRIALIHAGMQLTWQALQVADLTDEQLLELQRCWQELDALDALERGLVGERADCLERLAELAAGKPGSHATASSSGYVSRTIDRLNRVLLVETLMDRDMLFRIRHTQSEIVLVRSLETNHAWKDAYEGLRQLDLELAKVSNAPQRWFFSQSVSSIADRKPVFQQAVHAETERRMTIVATALRRYKLKNNNRVPPSLESLGADYLPIVPRDCMSTQTLRYQGRGDGTFLLYSVGTDGRDNGGDPSPSVSAGKPGLWEGRDAVWPWPAK